MHVNTLSGFPSEREEADVGGDEGSNGGALCLFVHSFIHLLFVFDSVALTPSCSSLPLLPLFLFPKKGSEKGILLIRCQENQRKDGKEESLSRCQV